MHADRVVPGSARGPAVAVAAFLVVMAAAGAGARLGGHRARLGAPPEGAEAARVARVVDGDTLALVDGRTVRLLGLDAPETVNPNMEGPQRFGPEAARRLAELVDHRTIHLERDTTEADHYGRSLRHVWLGGTLVAEVLVGEGLAWANALPPDVRHRERLRAAEEGARRQRLGLWGAGRPTPLFPFSLPAR